MKNKILKLISKEKDIDLKTLKRAFKAFNSIDTLIELADKVSNVEFKEIVDTEFE